MPAQFDAGVQHRSAGVPPELADLAARVIGLRRSSCIVNQPRSRWRFCSVAHTYRATSRNRLRARAKGADLREQKRHPETRHAEGDFARLASRLPSTSQDRPAQPPLGSVSA
jgi:hypothetical protein